MTGTSISAIWCLTRAMRSGEPVIQIALSRRSIARPLPERLAERKLFLLRLVLGADVIGLGLVEAGEPKPGSRRMKTLLGWIVSPLDEQADDLADVGIFEGHQLIGVARIVIDIGGNVGGRDDRLAARTERPAAERFLGADAW